MGAPLFHVGATAQCPHGSPITAVTANTRVLLGGQPAATFADTYLVTGCPFTVPPGKPQPCIKVQWLVPAARVRINGQPALLRNSVGLCLSADQIANGPPVVALTQMRVSGT